jgi:hypothetical protein
MAPTAAWRCIAFNWRCIALSRGRLCTLRLGEDLQVKRGWVKILCGLSLSEERAKAMISFQHAEDIREVRGQT